MNKTILILSIICLTILAGCVDNEFTEKTETDSKNSELKIKVEKKDKTKKEENVVSFEETNDNNDLKKEAEDYLNEVMIVSTKENDILNVYKEVMGGQYKNNEKILNKLNDEILPSYVEFKVELQKVQVGNRELKKAHQLYIDSTKYHYEAMLEFKKALTSDDKVAIDKMNENLIISQELMEMYITKIDEIIKKSKVIT